MSQTWNDLASLEVSSNASNLLIIDGNNLAYRWVGRNNYNDYAEEYINTIRSLAKSYNASKIVCCFDFGKSYYRLDLHSDYKGTRKKPETDEEQQKYDEFFNCLNTIIDNLPFEYHKYRGIEADDLITFICEKEKNNYDAIWIVSSDKDLYQLLDTNVFIFNLYSRKEITEDTLLETRGISPTEFLVAKIIQGDSGDNIKGIEGIGEKRSASIASGCESLNDLLKKLPLKGNAKYVKNLNSSKSILKLNEKLINLLGYNEVAIKAGKDGDDVWRMLNET